MNNKNENEMEQIQRGLEDFLEKELEQMGKAVPAGRGSRTGLQPGQAAGRQQDPEDSVRIIGKRLDEDQVDYGRDRGYFEEPVRGLQDVYHGRDDYGREEERYRQESRSRGEGYPGGGADEEEQYFRGAAYGHEEETGSGRRGYGGEDSGRRVYDEEEEEHESAVYDWDSEAARRRNSGQQRTHTRPDSGRERTSSGRERAGSSHQGYEQGGDYIRSDYAQGEQDSRGYGQEGRYPRRDSGREDRDARTSRRREENIRGEEDRGRGQHSKRKASGRQAQPREEDYQVAKKAAKSKKSQKKKRKKKHRLLKFLIAAAVIFVLLGAGLYQLVGVVYGKMTYHEIASLTQAPMKEDGVVNVLLIGNDSRENGEDGRSDAMILLSVSNKTKKIYMTSLLRDMYVDIPGHDGNRLNAAYSFGGAELLMETIEQNLDITVNRYVLVNFEAFASLVDAVGGIELELTSEEIEYVNGYLVEYNILTDRPQGTDNMDTSVSGLVHLNGPQALAYSRNRYLGTDFGRTDRQRKVLTAVIRKLPSTLVSNPKGLMDGLLPNLTTNLTRGECFSLSLMAGKMLTYDIESDSIPQPGTYRDVTIRKMSVLEVDFDTNIRYLKEKLYGE